MSVEEEDELLGRRDTRPFADPAQVSDEEDELLGRRDNRPFADSV